MFVKLLKRIFLCFFITSFGIQASSFTLVKKETLGDMYYGEIISEGSTAYIASDGILVLDVSDPTAPTEIAKISLDTDASIKKFIIDNKTLYAITNRKVFIVDITSLNSPKVLSTISKDINESYSAPYKGLAIKKDQLFLLSFYSHLDVYDIKNKNIPQKSESINISKEEYEFLSKDILSVNDYLISINQNSVVILSTTDENNLSRIYTDNYGTNKQSSYKTNHTAYINEIVFNVNYRDGNTIDIYNLSDKENIIKSKLQVNGKDFTKVEQIAIKDSILYVTGFFDPLEPHQLILTTFNLSSPTTPQFITNTRLDPILNLGRRSFTVVNENLIFSGYSQLIITEDSNKVSTYSNTNFSDVAIKNDTLITSNKNVIKTFDLSQPTFTHIDTQESVSSQIEISEQGYLYTSEGSIYDINADHQISPQGHLLSNNLALLKLNITNNKLYLSYFNQLIIQDLVTPLAPQQLSFINTEEITSDLIRWDNIFVKDELLFTATSRGLLRIDTNPTSLNGNYFTTNELNERARIIYINNNYLYTSTDSRHLKVWDIVDSNKPALLKSIDISDGVLSVPHDVKTSLPYKDWLFLFGWSGNTLVLNINDPMTPLANDMANVNNTLPHSSSLAIYDNQIFTTNSGQVIKYEINESPKISTDSFSTTEDITLDEQLSIINLENDILTYEIISNSSNGTTEVNQNGDVQYTPNSNFYGSDNFTVKVSDEYGNFTEKTINLTIIESNDAPTADTQSFSIQSLPLTAQLMADDVENDELSFELIEGVKNGSLTLNTNGSFTYEPSANFTGQDSFTYKITDIHNDFTESTVNITVQEPIEDKSTDTPDSTENNTSESGGGSTNYFLLMLFITCILMRQQQNQIKK